MARSRNNGLADLQKRLAKIPDEIKKAIDPALKRSAERMADRMRQFAPEDEGDLKESITVTTAGNSTPAYSQPGGSTTVPDGAVMITVGNTSTRYPHFVEYGTTDAEAQPFFWPAFRLERKKTEAAIVRAGRKAIRDGKAGK